MNGFLKETIWKEVCKHAYFIKAQVYFQGNIMYPNFDPCEFNDGLSPSRKICLQRGINARISSKKFLCYWRQ